MTGTRFGFFAAALAALGMLASFSAPGCRPAETQEQEPAGTAERPAGTPSEPAARSADQQPGARSEKELGPLAIELPAPRFKGTPKHIKFGEHVEKPSTKKRPPLMVPDGTHNVALGKPITSSDEDPIIGEPELATDGDKEAIEGSFVELGPGLQHIQIDLGGDCRIHAIVLWHYHGEGRVYHDVVVQVADDPDFITRVKTIYNNDYDNSSGLGLGGDLEYLETHQGRLIGVEGVKARYVRLYSNGNTSNEMNHYTEVEVYGKPTK